jgi:hypothetical protein
MTQRRALSSEPGADMHLPIRSRRMLHMVSLHRLTARVVVFVMFAVLMFAAGGVSSEVSARPLQQTSPTLGAAASYSVLAGSTVTNNGPTTMPGNLGVSPGSAVTGFPPGIVGPPGTIHAADASAANAQLANTAAF